jgi:DNA-binding MarR family transcriptional regulator
MKDTAGLTMVAKSRRPGTQEPDARGWTFLSNHGHVLLAIARHPDSRIRDIAQSVGITERAVLRIIAELESAGYLAHRRNGRRNSYVVQTKLPLRHPIEHHQQVEALLKLAVGPTNSRGSSP